MGSNDVSRILSLDGDYGSVLFHSKMILKLSLHLLLVSKMILKLSLHLLLVILNLLGLQ